MANYEYIAHVSGYCDGDVSADTKKEAERKAIVDAIESTGIGGIVSVEIQEINEAE